MNWPLLLGLWLLGFLIFVPMFTGGGEAYKPTPDFGRDR